MKFYKILSVLNLLLVIVVLLFFTISLLTNFWVTGTNEFNSQKYAEITHQHKNQSGAYIKMFINYGLHVYCEESIGATHFKVISDTFTCKSYAAIKILEEQWMETHQNDTKFHEVFQNLIDRKFSLYQLLR